MDELLEDVAFASVHGFITDNHFGPEIQQIFEDNAVDMEWENSQGLAQQSDQSDFTDRQICTPALRKATKVADDQLTDDVLKKVEWMKHHPPSRENTSQMRTYFKNTRNHRKNIMHGLTITDALSHFPRYRDMPSLIVLDFELQFGKDVSSSLLTNWKVDFLGAIMKVARKVPESSQAGLLLSAHQKWDDVDLCALKLLVAMLPSSNAYSSKKGKKSASSRVDAVNYVFQHKPIGTDVMFFAETKDDKYAEPFLLCLGTPINPTDYYVICDNTSVPAGTTALAAFDLLFKIHYIFSVEFSGCVHTFYNFFDAFFYGINTYTASSLLRSFWARLKTTSTKLENKCAENLSK
ncbi:uncharacterized protein LOC117115494 [Anneissia japonica]|uniref:uncharacterized protein LOC117115494 n=1 Tax=Anneissia japonica TaxID=1529436 RepID=UPI001425B7B6|nr:uncharacterized protein LOC117115494 [Anneissia japonica]